MKYNERYVIYARAHGKDPEEMKAHDRQKYPGGCMCGFINWVQGRAADYRKSNGLSRFESISKQEAFTSYLREAAQNEN